MLQNVARSFLRSSAALHAIGVSGQAGAKNAEDELFASIRENPVVMDKGEIGCGKARVSARRGYQGWGVENYVA